MAGPGAAATAGGGLARWARRAWNAPLWMHAAVLAVLLVALLALVGSGSSFSADEGAAIVQARSLARGDGWTVEHPVPEADRTGANYPLELSERGPRGFAPFGKHPLYALLLAGVDRLGGVAAMVLLSVAGTVAAAALAVRLARRLDPALERAALWTVGVASPLLFDGYLVIAHTLGAALAAAAVLVAVLAIERRQPVVGLAVLPLVGAAVLLRREALLLAAALAVAGCALALRRSTGNRRRAAGAVVLTALAGAGAAQVLEQLWTRSVLGGSLAWSGVRTPGTGSSGLVAGRLRGFLLTWLTPGYGASSLAPLALLVMLVAVAVAAVALRRRPALQATVGRWSLVAAGAALVALATGPTTVVPGFLVAFPLATAGLLLVRAETLRPLAARVSLGVFAVFALGVLATQYPKGGAGEWGGRYFAIGIPFLVPVLLLALRDAGARLSGRARRRALASLAVCSLALAAMGVLALRHHHQRTAQLVAVFERAGRAAAEATAAETDGRPVLISTQGSAPRFAWATFDRQRWLLSRPSGLPDLLVRLRAAGVTHAAFVTRDLERDRPLLAGTHVLSSDGTASARGWHVLVLRLT